MTEPSTTPSNPAPRTASLPEAAPIPPYWHPGRMLRRLAGVDEELLSWVPQERPRYTGLGGTVLSTATLAFLSMAFAIGQLLGGFTFWVLIPAGVWFLVILNLDRWIVATPPGPELRHRFSSVLIRLVVAVVIGVVIAEPLVLRIFETAIVQYIKDTRDDAERSLRSQLEECNPVPPPRQPKDGCGEKLLAPAAGELNRLEDEKANKEKQRQDLQAAVKPLDDQLAVMRENERKECAGEPGSGFTGRYGNGPVCQKLTATREEFERTHQTTEKHQAIAGLDADITKLTEDIGTATSAWGKKRDEYIAEQTDSLRANQGDIGLLERMDALRVLAGQHGTLAWGIWAVRLLFILVDIVPALFKFLGGITRYDRLTVESLERGELEFAAIKADRLNRARMWAMQQRDDLAIEEARRAAERAGQREKIMDDLQLTWTVPGIPKANGTDYGGATLLEDFTGELGFTRLDQDGRIQGHDDVGPGGLDDAADDTPPEPAPQLKRIPFFNVVMIGGRGTGKTTLMAMLHHELSTDDHDNPRGYSIRCTDPVKWAQLNKFYRQLASPGDAWPPPTGFEAIEKFEFDCYVESGDRGGTPVLRLRYWDYAGEVVGTDATIEPELRTELDKRLRTADVVVVAIDGMRLRDSEFDRFESAELDQQLTEYAQLVNNVECPIQLLITKWDRLVEPNPYEPQARPWTLKEALREIQRVPAMRNLITGRKTAGQLRVIPLSVTGRNVVDEQRSDDGIVRMAKVSAPNPINIDVPFAAMLPDRLTEAFNDLGPQAVKAAFRRARRAQSIYWLRRLAGFAGWVVRGISVKFTALPVPAIELNWGQAEIDRDPDAGWMRAYAQSERFGRRRIGKDLADELRDKARELQKRASWSVRAKETLLERLEARLRRFEAESAREHMPNQRRATTSPPAPVPPQLGLAGSDV
ncbi:DUF4407 domain-containing protein [Dactylosporangium sp. NPDC000244]|uniref:DUF4407 domain-containing protein n=1 Tax=Dactylosporangium sp. NPDC000244 TaxID=3154365 RepID=UPI00332D69C6